MNASTKRILRPIITTVIGGVVFLIPITVVVGIVGKGLVATTKASEPVVELLPVHEALGHLIVQTLAIVFLFLICYLAGKVTRMAVGRAVTDSVESKLQVIYPRYTVIKAMTQSLRGEGDVDKLKSVFVCFDDNAQIAFEVERGENGLVTVFMPGSPDPWSGTVLHVLANRVFPLDTDFKQLNKKIKALGRGTAAILDEQLKGVELPWE